ncbi:hypothetical protein LZ31DRAFT_328414 [Colletotrichum somersetense]|nr:hypothetical protein LZ31DRAFT_328414 [Colletotrichum somersetense]
MRELQTSSGPDVALPSTEDKRDSRHPCTNCTIPRTLPSYQKTPFLFRKLLDYRSSYPHQVHLGYLAQCA